MIHVPPLQPDEIAWGFLCRIRALNVPQPDGQRASPLQAWVRALREEQGVRSNIALIAELTGTSPDDVEYRHTLAPLLGIMMPSVVLEKPSECRRPLRWHHPHQHSAYLCRRCAEEDLNFWGFSYWRRSHQTPGVAWCPKHRCPLEYVEQRGGIAGLPHTVIPRFQRDTTCEVATHGLENPTVLRYGEVCQAFLECARPFRSEQFVRCTKRRATQLGVRMFTLPWLDGPYLSDLARMSVSGPWLQRFFPAVSSETFGTYVGSLDRTITHVWGGLSPLAYALALALLYESADEAMHALTSTPAFAESPESDAPPVKREESNERGPTVSGSLEVERAGTVMSVQAALRAFAAGAPIQVACLSTGVAPPMLEQALRCALAKQGMPEH